MNKLDAYKQAKLDLAFAEETCKTLKVSLNEIPEISVGNTISINKNSSDKQYVYAVGVLNNQVVACTELGIDPKEYEESKNNVLKFRKLNAELKEWDNYTCELDNYQAKIYRLLDNNELFELLEAPVKP
jgi:hypothetical protein